MAELFLEKNDPVRKAGRETQLVSSDIPNSKPIPSVVQHEVRLRDQGQCIYVDLHGPRCVNKRWVEPHHIKHRKEGGRNTTENLVTLCSTHHRGEHFLIRTHSHRTWSAVDQGIICGLGIAVVIVVINRDLHEIAVDASKKFAWVLHMRMTHDDGS